MERHNLLLNDVLKFRCKLDSQDGKDTARAFTGVFFPRWRALYLDEVHTVVGMRGQTSIKLTPVYDFDVFFKVPPAVGSSSSSVSLDASASSSGFFGEYFTTADFKVGAKVKLGLTVSARDEHAKLFYITAVDASLLLTKTTPGPGSSNLLTLSRLAGRSYPQETLDVFGKLRAAYVERAGGDATLALKNFGRRFREPIVPGGRRVVDVDRLVRCAADVAIVFSRAEAEAAISGLTPVPLTGASMATFMASTKATIVATSSGPLMADYNDVLELLRGPFSTARTQAVQTAFAFIDTNGDGYATLDELAGHLDLSWHSDVRSGAITRQQAARAFMAVWDAKDRLQKVSYAEFFDYYSGVSAITSDDEEFVGLVCATWKVPHGAIKSLATVRA
jgi:hypothetical protein